MMAIANAMRIGMYTSNADRTPRRAEDCWNTRTSPKMTSNPTEIPMPTISPAGSAGLVAAAGQPGEQLGVVVGSLGLGPHRRVDHGGVLADEDPPGPRPDPVEDDGRRLGRAD